MCSVPLGLTAPGLSLTCGWGLRCKPRERLQLPDTPAHLPCMLSKYDDQVLIFKGRQIHPSHKLGFRANRLFCWRCCQWAERNVRNLRRYCKDPNKYTQRDLQRWLTRVTADNDRTAVPYSIKRMCTDYVPGDAIVPSEGGLL